MFASFIQYHQSGQTRIVFPANRGVMPHREQSQCCRDQPLRREAHYDAGVTRGRSPRFRSNAVMPMRLSEVSLVGPQGRMQRLLTPPPRSRQQKTSQAFNALNISDSMRWNAPLTQHPGAHTGFVKRSTKRSTDEKVDRRDVHANPLRVKKPIDRNQVTTETK